MIGYAFRDEAKSLTRIGEGAAADGAVGLPAFILSCFLLAIEMGGYVIWGCVVK
jgi:hypothetical protein